MMTGELLRAARALARLDQAELASASGLSLETVKRLERIRGQINANARTVMALQQAFAELGIHLEMRADGSQAVVLRPDAMAVGGVVAPAPAGDPTRLRRVVYHSVAEDRVAQALPQILDDIASISTVRNSVLGVSGALMAADGRFLQALEGGEEAVQTILDSIRRDPRHRTLAVVEDRAIGVRRFPGWVLCLRGVTPGELAKADASQAAGFDPGPLSPVACLGLLSWMADLEARELGPR